MQDVPSGKQSVRTHVMHMYSVIRSLWSGTDQFYTGDHAKHVDAQIVHEAAIGRINDEQLIKLRTFGLSEEEAESVIIENFLK